MGLLSKIGLGPEPSLKEQTQLREFRQSYLDFLSSEQGRIINDQDANRITPESSQLLLKRIQDSQSWLQKNPNANMLELQANRDDTKIEMKRVRDVDRPRGSLQSLVNGIPGLIDYYGKQMNLLKSNEQSVLRTISVQIKSWLISNPNASLIDVKQKVQSSKNDILRGVSDASLRSSMTRDIESILSMTPQDASNLSTRFEEQAKTTEKLEFKASTLTQQIITTALSVFGGFLLIALCLFCGSLAANQAIGREPAYRVLYFLWGAFPLFAPFVALQSILKRISEGPIPMYGILPVSTEPAVSRLGKLLWYPFYWIPDATSDSLTEQYLKSLERIA